MDGDLGGWQVHAAYAAAWASFGALHSLLAHEPWRTRLKQACGAQARLVYNAIALVHLGLVYAAGAWLFRGLPAIMWPTPVVAALTAVHVAGWVLLVVAVRGYEPNRLIGVTQLSEGRRGVTAPADDEPLRTDGLHDRLRHPLYAAGLLILWGQALGGWGLATAVWGSLYLVIGARLEERRLSALWGKAYDDYRARVPAFLPRLGRHRAAPP